MTKIVEFVKNIGPYTPGDRAGFADEAADSYVERGFAVPDGAKPTVGEPAVAPEGSAVPEIPAEGRRGRGRK